MSETREQAATRRRWVTLAEFVAVAGLLIGALTLYLNWSDRRDDQAVRAEEAASAGKAKSIVTLTGKVESGGRTIALSDATHDIASATVRFPTAIGVASQDAMPGPRIEADWFAPAILKLTDDGADERSGRLPVLISVDWWDGDTRRRSEARYDVLWHTEGRVLQGRKLTLTGVTLADRSSTPAELDAAWRRVDPSTK